MNTAEILTMVCGIGAFLTIIYWVRKRELREKYAIAWIAVSIAALTLGVFPMVIRRVANMMLIGQGTAVLLFALGPLLLFCFSVSVSLSRSHRRQSRLTQEIGLLEQRIRELEQKLAESKEDEVDS